MLGLLPSLTLAGLVSQLRNVLLRPPYSPPGPEYCSEPCSREFACYSSYTTKNECLEQLKELAKWQNDITGTVGILRKAGCTKNCIPRPSNCSRCRLDVGLVPQHLRPLRPTLCTEATQGRCECANLAARRTVGLVTYTWWRGSAQRCATTYVPPRTPLQAKRRAPLPVIVHFNAHACDTLWKMGMQEEDPLLVAARQYGFATLALSSPTEKWTFGNNGIVNRTHPMPCDARANVDLAYVEEALEALVIHNPTGFRRDRLYVEGESVNGMFAEYVAHCLSNFVAGVFRPQSGLTARGLDGPLLPQREGLCSESSFARYRGACIHKEPCKNCEFWPIYPCYSSRRPMVECLVAYTNDELVSAKPDDPRTTDTLLDHAFWALDREGHDVRMVKLGAHERHSGHQPPLNKYEWMVGCLGVKPPCDDEVCTRLLFLCMKRRRREGAEPKDVAWRECLGSASLADAGCSTCGPTLPMLSLSEGNPVEAQLALRTFGRHREPRREVPRRERPHGSQCVADGTGYR